MEAENQNTEERRKSFRLDMEKEMVDIVWKNESGQEIRKKIVCVDFSKGGLKLDCDQAIALSTEVFVIFKAAEDQKLVGKIIRCLQQENGWFEIAIRLNE